LGIFALYIGVLTDGEHSHRCNSRDITLSE